MDEMLPPMTALNRHIAQHGSHSLLNTYTQTPHSCYYGMAGKNFWEVLTSSPERIKQFSDGLALYAANYPVVAIFPFEESLLPGNSPDRVLAIDVGGGQGLAMLELRNGCPRLQGGLVLQDLEYVLKDIKPEALPGVSVMAHDFFTEQPVKNAQVYYIRRVMHDWQDEDCARILKAIKPAMGSDSRILISDMALPEPSTPADAHAMWMDMMMMEIGGKERTRRDWQTLADMAGLKLMKVWQEPEKTGPLCVVEYMLPSAAEPSITTNGIEKEVTTPKAQSTESQPNPSEFGLDSTSQQREVDWDERTVVGDRGQSVEPESHA
jgi:hypothetical protein